VLTVVSGSVRGDAQQGRGASLSMPVTSGRNSSGDAIIEEEVRTVLKTGKTRGIWHMESTLNCYVIRLQPESWLRIRKLEAQGPSNSYFSMQANFHPNRSRVPRIFRAFLVVYLRNLERGQRGDEVELADLTRCMRKSKFSEPEKLYCCKAGLVSWVGPRTEKEQLQHFISESHKGSAKKIILRIAKKNTQPQPRPNPSPEPRGCCFARPLGSARM